MNENMSTQNGNRETQLPERSVINSLEFITFKGLDGLNIDFNAQEKNVTAIFGKNGLGKSSILNVLRCIYQTKYIDNSAGEYKGKYILYADNTLFKDICKNIDNSNWDGSKFKISYSGISEEGKLCAAQEMMYEKRKGQAWIPNRKNSLLQNIYFIGVDSGVPDVERYKKIGLNLKTTTILEVNHSNEIEKCASYIMENEYSDFHYVKTSYANYLNKNRLSAVVNLNFRPITFESTDGLSVCKNGHSYNSMFLSAGEQRLFKILTILYNAPEYSLLLIDEIELTLHSAALNRLIDKVVEISKQKNIQVIFTSHREQLLDRTDINIRSIVSIEGTIRCVNGRASDCYQQLSGSYKYNYAIYVEDRLSRYIVRELINDNNLKGLIYVDTFGASNNAYFVAYSLYAQQNRDKFSKRDNNIKIVLDGDVDVSQEEKIKAFNAIYSGNEPGKEAFVRKVIEPIMQYELPENSSSHKRPNLEKYIFDVLTHSKVAHDDYSPYAKIIRTAHNLPIESLVANSANSYAGKHIFLDALMDQLGEDTEAYLPILINMFKTNHSAEWKKMTAPVASWLRYIANKEGRNICQPTA